MGIPEYEYEGVTFYFIDNESYFWGDRPYGDWYYDPEVPLLLQGGISHPLPVIGFKPDVIHCHDCRRTYPGASQDKFHGGEFSGISSPS